MAIKSLKTKIAVGVVATGIVASMGTAFAGVDIAGQFNSWYNTKFGAATTKVAVDATIDYGKKLSSYNNEYNQLKTDSTTGVTAYQKDQSDASMLAINKQKNDYITQVNAAADGLSAKAPSDFQGFVNGVNATVDGLKSEAKKYGENGLKSSVEDQSKKSVEQVGKDVAAYQKSSTDNLTATIKDRQDKLNKLIQDQAATSDKAIRANIEAKIAELRAELNDYAKQQVEAAKTNVKAEADTKTAAALAALEAAAVIK
ncbi:hypothetical protein HGI30_22370 [Paenibacillus albicereus]|uniref:Uncharacterized protein n=1 Tax=Paenibacillus albicereus TaxID=2726185 RepID=A0A6H2H2W2_9BACL|nr:hypothetical protein [Paenibacillus albicereus]QJC53997.1 hypothetical protein HGI30_22370 [Paenibacillus albicereus]